MRAWTYDLFRAMTQQLYLILGVVNTAYGMITAGVVYILGSQLRRTGNIFI
jgi:hypothetical protein